MKRTNNCNELTKEDIGKEISLIGWCKSLRDHGGKKFIDLRDKEGVTQIVFDPDITKDFEKVEHFKKEYLIQVNGKVRERPKDQENLKLKTGQIEIIIKEYKIINESENIPFGIDDEKDESPNEDLRLEYRYLDLRRESMTKIIKNRSRFIKKIRDIFEKEGFIEIETPILTNSSPEGARDFLVPSRKNKGKFFALPQAPQIFKQLLMVSGFEKYFQIARCFRDEDSRKDRQLEFSQIDCEISFYSQEEIFTFLKKLITTSFKEVYNLDIKDEILTLSYEKCVNDYGTDKPDLRITLPKLFDISKVCENCEFSVFSNNVKNKGIVKGIRLPQGNKLMTRGDIDKLIQLAQKEFKSKGLAWMIKKDNKLESSITKFFKEEELKEIEKISNCENEDILFFVSDSFEETNDILDNLRRHLAQTYNLKENSHKIIFVNDFPMFHYNKDLKKIEFEHNPFSMCLEKDLDYLLNLDINNLEKEKEKLLSLKSDCYDMVYNGFEICSGAKRIHLPKLQEKVFQITGFKKKKLKKIFLI